MTRRTLALALLLALALAALTACGAPADEPTSDAFDAAADAGEPAAPAAEQPTSFDCTPPADPPAQYDAPQQVIRDGYDYEATITLDTGSEVVIDLYPEEAPITVNNFVFLACQGFYDETTFHRVLPGFVAQGGDPTGTGTGGPGYTIEHEADNGVPFDRAGLVSMAHRMQPNTTGSQFFITYAPTPDLDAQFTVFGEVIDGMRSVEGLAPRDPQKDPNAIPGDAIETIRVREIAP